MNEPFQNLQIAIDNLPKVEQIDFQPIHKDYLKVMLIGSAIFFVILAAGIVAVMIFADDPSPLALPIMASGWGVLLIWNLSITILAFKKRRYALRGRDIIYMKGLIWSVRTAIPFNRVQHAEVKQGPIERMYKLSSLKVFTAGGQSSDLVIPGLPNHTAQELKDFILGKTAEDGTEST